MTTNKKRFGLRAKAALVILLLGTLLLQVDTFRLTPARAVASTHMFSLVQWEVTHFPRKWLHLLWEALPGKKPSREERLVILDEYLTLARRAQKEQDRLDGLFLARGTGAAPTGGTGDRTSPSDEHLKELTKAREDLRGRAEEAIEAEISTVVIEEGLGSIWGLLIPPVDIWFGEPPTILITSPRDRIYLQDQALLSPDLPLLERDRLEKQILEEFNLSALIDDLAGLSTYPSLVSDVDTLRDVLQTTAHEWLHAYFFFRPLGQNFRKSEDMFTVNETVADLAARELGDTAFARMGGDLNVSPSRYLSDEERAPRFTLEMRETRLRAGELLAQGQVEEAEQYMKERWWFLRLGGYRLRKLNQAYFAFRGRYAESAGSVSPIGDQVKELRGLVSSVGSFVQTVSKVSSYPGFLDLLERLKAQQRPEASATP